MGSENIDTEAVIAKLNQILEMELAGTVRYTHYSFMVFGYSRIPIISWLRKEAEESLAHAHEAGEMITHLGGHPSLGIGPLLETHNHDIGAILRESLEHEKATLKVYFELLTLVEERAVFLEEYARRLISIEEVHQGELNKMLRKPGEVGVFSL